MQVCFSVDKYINIFIIRGKNYTYSLLMKRCRGRAVLSEGRDCYYESDLGNSYNGRANTTATGRACLSWAGSSNAFYKNDRKAFHEFDANYCRAYEYWDYKSREPLCIVEYPDVLRSCGVPKCGECWKNKSRLSQDYSANNINHILVKTPLH